MNCFKLVKPVRRMRGAQGLAEAISLTITVTQLDLNAPAIRS